MRKYRKIKTGLSCPSLLLYDQILLGWPKSLFNFFCMMALVVLSYLELHSKQFFSLYCDSYYISVHLKKSKLVNFCATILILKMEKYATFSGHYAFLFEER